MKTLLLLLLVCSLTACVSTTTTLKNAEGKEAFCSATGYGIIGSMVASSRYDECMAKLKEKGYK